MIPREELAELKLLPRDEEGPIFNEPWQAQAFAVIVRLTESGRLTWQDWGDRLGAVLREAEERGDVETGHHYYEHWLTALERLVVERGLVRWEDLTKEGTAIRESDHHRREDQLKGSP